MTREVLYEQVVDGVTIVSERQVTSRSGNKNWEVALQIYLYLV